MYAVIMWGQYHTWRCQNQTLLPVDTRRWTNAGLMLAWRRRRRANIKQALVQRAFEQFGALCPGRGGLKRIEARYIANTSHGKY